MTGTTTNRLHGFVSGRPGMLLLLSVPLLWLLATTLPEVLRDRIYPFDSALIAANGALFASLFSDIGGFLSAPMDWLWTYYDQYPALSVRRHPPLFGLVAGLIYSIVGVSAPAAKLTIMLFGVAFAVGVFFVAKRLLSSNLLAACTALLLVATPQVAMHFRSVWLDIPSLAFAIWVVYFYLARLDGDGSFRNVLGMVVFAVLALYTYQPTVVLLAGIFAHLAIMEWKSLYKDGPLLAGAGVLVVLMLPLVAFTIYFASDNLQATTGEIPEEWKEFSSPTYAEWMVRDKLSIAYWTEYARMILRTYPLQSIGLLLWMALRFVRKPTTGETLMFVCLVVTYVSLSWLLVKGHRYTLYMMIPASFLTVAAGRDAFDRLARDVGSAALYASAILVPLTVIQFGLISVWVPYRYLAGMDAAITSILEEDPNATIFYSGRTDAAFVFYTRSLDDRRGTSIHRASVQLADPRALEDYVDKESIDFIVVEIENEGYDSLESIDAFLVAIRTYLREHPAFELRSEFRLPYGAFDEEGSVLLHVYGRTR